MALAVGEKTKVKIGATYLGKIVSINDPNAERDWVDQTNNDSTAEEGRPSYLPKGSEWSVDCHYDPSVHTTLLGKISDSTSETIAIEFCDADGTALDTQSAAGYVMGYGWSAMGRNETPIVQYKLRWVEPPTM